MSERILRRATSINDGDILAPTWTPTKGPPKYYNSNEHQAPSIRHQGAIMLTIGHHGMRGIPPEVSWTEESDGTGRCPEPHRGARHRGRRARQAPQLPPGAPHGRGE